MEVKSTYKYARISPKKARDVARAIQGMPVSDALDALAYTPRKAAQLIGKTLKSAVANAENNHELIADELTVKQATVGDGPTFKRFKPRARGSAGAIRKRTSHLYIVLTDEEEIPEPRERSSKPKKRLQVSKPKKKAAKKEQKEAAPEEVEEVKAETQEVEAVEANTEGAGEAQAATAQAEEVQAEAADQEVEAEAKDESKSEDK